MRESFMIPNTRPVPGLHGRNIRNYLIDINKGGYTSASPETFTTTLFFKKYKGKAAPDEEIAE